MKRIILGLDGTANAAYYDTHFTNVFKIDLALKAIDRNDDNAQEIPQLFFYLSGVGASAYKHMGLPGKLFGQGIDELILQAYINLVSNYEEGDEIYIFGFSRGSVAARALTGMISRAGLLKYEYTSHIPSAWNFYLNSQKAGNYLSEMHRITYRDTKIEFLGVWDSVYGINPRLALGNKLITKLKFPDFRLDAGVKHAVHILSLDDTRPHFEVMMFDGVSDASQTLHQIWMPGVHSDIGGGYMEDFLSTVSLLTMLDMLREIKGVDIVVDEDFVQSDLRLRLDKMNVVVNNEWGLGRVSYYIPWSRKVKEFQDNKRKQTLHPLVLTIRGKSIRYKDCDRDYMPACRGICPDDIYQLDITPFSNKSYWNTLVKPALEKKGMT